MLLRNYDNIIVDITRPCIGIKNLGHGTFGNGSLALKDTYGNIKSIYKYDEMRAPFYDFYESGNDTCNRIWSSNLICGLGSTPETYDDYKLESAFTTKQISSVSGVHKTEEPVYNEETNTWTFTYSRNYLANEDITVREIGVLYEHYAFDGLSSGRTAGKTLVYRKVLETPLEVTAGNQFKLTFTATLYANPNKPADYEATANVE